MALPSLRGAHCRRTHVWMCQELLEEGVHIDSVVENGIKAFRALPMMSSLHSCGSAG